MLPTGTIHIDTFLSGVLIGKRNSKFIADDVLPPIFSSKLTGKVAKMSDEHYRVDFAARALGNPGNMVNWAVDSTSYALEEFRLEHPVDDIEIAAYDDPYEPRRDAQLVLWHKLMLKKEKLVAGLVMTSGNYASGHVDNANKSWDVPATGKPVTDVQTGVATIISKSGASETEIYGVCSYNVFRWLRANDQVRQNFINTTRGAANVSNMTAADVASALGIAGLYVGPAIEVTSKEGQTNTKAYVWGLDDFALFYKTGEPGIMSPNFGYQVFPRIPGLPGAQVVSDVYRQENITSDVVRSRMILDQIVGDNEMGYIFTSVDAT